MRSPLLRFLLHHCLIGIASGWLVLGGLLASNAMGLRDLIFTSNHWLEAMVLLLVFFAITFGSLAMGTGVMMMSDTDEGPKKPRRIRLGDRLGTRWGLQLAPAKVQNKRHKR